MTRLLQTTLVLVLFAAPAFAQTRSARPVADRPGLMAFGSYDLVTIASKQTFETVFGTATTHALGGGVDVVNVWKHVFLRVAKSSGSLDGERVAIAGSDVFKLGTKITAKLTPTELGAGWRFERSRSRLRLTPYLGASVVLLSYNETSQFADPGENVSETFSGFGAFGGVDVTIARNIFAGAEAQYRVINSSPGPNSAAAHFNEKNLGGAVLRVRLGIRF